MGEGSFHVSTHAACRYKERIKPGLEYEDAKKELESLVKMFGRIVPFPAWAARPRPGSQFLELSDGLGAVIMDGHEITTIVARGGMKPEQRQERNARRSRRRSARLTRSKHFASKKLGRRPEIKEPFEWE